MTRPEVLRCGLIGCGQVAHEYVSTLKDQPSVRIVACADAKRDAAASFGAQHGIPHCADVNDLFLHEEINTAVILSPPDTHAALALRALGAGLHIYVEKPLGLNPSGTERILKQAQEAGLLVGAAPDTPLAPPITTANQAIRTGLIGTPLAADAALLSPGPEQWHSTPEPFYSASAGPLRDMGPYYLSAVSELLGPIDSVESARLRGQRRRTVRVGSRAGETFHADVPTHVTAVLRTDSQVWVNVTTSFDVPATTRPHIEIYGIDGTLVIPDPNFHAGPVTYRARNRRDWQVLKHNPADSRVAGRGMGVLELARDVRNGVSACLSGHRAHHVVEVINAIEAADRLKKPADVAGWRVDI